MKLNFSVCITSWSELMKLNFSVCITSWSELMKLNFSVCITDNWACNASLCWNCDCVLHTLVCDGHDHASVLSVWSP